MKGAKTLQGAVEALKSIDVGFSSSNVTLRKLFERVCWHVQLFCSTYRMVCLAMVKHTIIAKLDF